MSREPDDLDKPYIVWIDYGYEGWSPTGYSTLKEAIASNKYGSEWVITGGAIDWTAVERPVRPSPKIEG